MSLKLYVWWNYAGEKETVCVARSLDEARRLVREKDPSHGDWFTRYDPKIYDVPVAV